MLSIIDNIKLLDFFSELDDKNLNRLCTISKVSKYPDGYTLYHEEDEHDKIFFLISGLMKTYKVDRLDNEIFLNYIYENRLISEISSLNENKISCFTNTEFIKDSVVLEVDYALFKEYFIRTNILTNQFISQILLSSKQLYHIIDREVVFDAMAKVAYSLYDDLKMFNKLKRQDVASMLHIQPATLSRVLKKLLRLEIISVEMTNIQILQRDKLKKIFNGAA